ncbi:TolC family protein [Rhabdobacter roseus]|uniref:NodT family efflux transporter outer membrane factor (OMF) lipoprotein n=1 Tax=Rhabdobacter roseus TaxID=1655419 RepID=A0A840TYZ4_9BACT|nr:TolC family protein [Rhabdobacter roseus]MBB5286523.1 NodT family efflux transporter outer membrane factor (OMF) lipoprotein [Rhabdobacter roseus]
MKNKSIYPLIGVAWIVLSVWGCKITEPAVRTENKTVPASYAHSGDTLNSTRLNWRDYFADENLISLIDTALKNNQELHITLQEISISQNEIRARKGEYLPFVHFRAGAGVEKAGRYTRDGAVERQLDIRPGREFPDPLTDFGLGAYATWEVDIWKKLRNAKKSAIARYLASIEGKNFMVTNLIAEIADAYYELMALDNTLNILEQNSQIQSNALRVVQMQKNAAKVTQLAVNRFEAQLLNTQNLQFEVKQKIVETENRINFLTARFPRPIPRASVSFDTMNIDSIQAGVPAQLLVNRPDIRQAEYELAAAKLDVKVARANFYPSLGISAGVSFQAFNPVFLVRPESILYNLAGDLIAPLINRNAIKATYYSANAQQVQAAYNYEKTILNAYVDVLNQLSRMANFEKSYQTKQREVELLRQSVTIASSLFNSARADYGEVLLTQREALESRMDLIEIKMKRLNAKVNMYRALGGGWN